METDAPTTPEHILRPRTAALLTLFKRLGLPELVRWCLPALIIGALLRIALTFTMPLAYVQYDSRDFLFTTKTMIVKHRFEVQSKRSYLTPALFSAAFALPVPALYTIAAAQHLMGLLAILVAGGIVRLWFRHWKWFIVPVTLIVGANPMIIWYEHSLLGEAQYLFFSLLAGLAATAWFKRPTRITFGFFMLSLVLVSGTRLEGKLLFLVALALIPLVHWGKWKSLFVHQAIALSLMLFGFAASGGRVASPLLLASIFQLAPDQLQCAPDFTPYILPLRDELRGNSDGLPHSLIQTSKQLSRAAGKYLATTYSRPVPREEQKRYQAALLGKVCWEIMRTNPVQVLILPFTKFHLAIDAWSAYCWNEHYLHQRQWEALTSKSWMSEVLSKGLTGRKQTPEELRDYVTTRYSAERVQWFTDYQSSWNNLRIALRTADRPLKQARWVHDFFGGVPGGLPTMPGFPYFYMASAAGLLIGILRWRQFGALHLAWGGCLFSIMYAGLMVGVTNARFRFCYEPFFLLYFFLLLDCLWAAIRSKRSA